MGIAEEMMEYIEQRSGEEKFQRANKVREKDFTRQRKLGFVDVIKYIIGNPRESLELGKERYSEAKGLESISCAAITKARSRIRYTAIEELFEETAERIPRPKKIEGYEVIAIDGVQGEMPKTPDLMKTYQVSKTSGYPQFHAISGTDILNGIILAADFVPAPGNEYKMALDLLEHPCFRKERRQILLYDRGFPSVALIQKLNEMGKKFVMRVSRSFLKEVNQFGKGTRVDQLINIHYTKRRGATNRVHARLPYDFDLRCLRLRLPSNEDEICITNLERNLFPKRIINQLYRLRWGIETSYNNLKNSFFLEEFSSRKENNIKQDFYATLLGANLLNALLDLDYPLPKSEEKKTVLSV